VRYTRAKDVVSDWDKPTDLDPQDSPPEISLKWLALYLVTSLLRADASGNYMDKSE